jgi:hypothetical protein
MRTKLIFLCLLLSAAAPLPDPEKVALGQMLVEAANREANFRAQVVALQQKLASQECPKVGAEKAPITPPAVAPKPGK